MDCTVLYEILDSGVCFLKRLDQCCYSEKVYFGIYIEF